MSTENPKIHVSGLDFEWDQEKGAFLINGNATVAMWIESTMAGFMSGLHRMVGTDRFNLAVYGAGEDGIEGEWEHLIMKCPTVEEGLATIGKLAAQLVADGQQVLRQIKGDERLRDVPVVMFSADYTYETMCQSLRMGAQDFVVKGTVGWGELCERVAQHAEHARQAG